MNKKFLEAYARDLWRSHGWEEEWQEIHDKSNKEHKDNAQRLWNIATKKAETEG